MIKEIKNLNPIQPPRHELSQWTTPLELDLERLVWDWEYRESMRPFWSKERRPLRLARRH